MRHNQYYKMTVGPNNRLVEYILLLSALATTSTLPLSLVMLLAS